MTNCMSDDNTITKPFPRALNRWQPRAGTRNSRSGHLPWTGLCKESGKDLLDITSPNVSGQLWPSCPSSIWWLLCSFSSPAPSCWTMSSWQYWAFGKFDVSCHCLVVRDKKPCSCWNICIVLFSSCYAPQTYPWHSSSLTPDALVERRPHAMMISNQKRTEATPSG